MAQVSCPHCGVTLPYIVDAFCPECRNSLDESPLIHDTIRPQPVGKVEGSPRDLLGFLMIFGGLAAVCIGFLLVGRGAWPEAISTGGGGLVVALLGVLWNRRASKFPQRYTWRSLALVVIGVGVMVWSIQPQPQPIVESADIAGVAKPGDYRNPYFGFRVRYGDDWQDVTKEAQTRATEEVEVGTDKSPVLLALARAPAADQNRDASLMIVVDRLAKQASPSGADYLRRMLLQLQQRRPPRRTSK